MIVSYHFHTDVVNMDGRFPVMQAEFLSRGFGPNSDFPISFTMSMRLKMNVDVENDPSIDQAI